MLHIAHMYHMLHIAHMYHMLHIAHMYHMLHIAQSGGGVVYYTDCISAEG